MNLFQRGDFVLHSGQHSSFKLECDALTSGDIETIAFLLWQRVGPYGEVEGVPRGGLRLAAAMKRYTIGKSTRLLIVDDVTTTSPPASTGLLSSAGVSSHEGASDGERRRIRWKSRNTSGWS